MDREEFKIGFDLPVDRLHQAIGERHSRRKYREKSVENKKAEKLSELTGKINSNIKSVRIEFFNQKNENIFKGIIGAYGKISGAPAYAVFIGDHDDEHVNEKLGYAGELFILEATALGLNTCWVSGMFNPTTAAGEVELSSSEKIMAVTPIGYAEETKAISEKLMSAFAGSHKRKYLEQICIDHVNQKWPVTIKSGLNAARLAPSAVNRQPWRFKIKEGSLAILTVKAKPAWRLDCGIAMAHLELGCRKEGQAGHWVLLEGHEVAAYVFE